MKQKVDLETYQDYMSSLYSASDERDLFMKLAEEFGETARELNAKYGLKEERFDKDNFSEELIDMIHYIVAIATINGVDLTDILLKKDEKGSIKHNRPTNLKNYLSNKTNH